MRFFKSNFSLIAENTTKFYLELTKRYPNRFSNDISLLAIAGILDAQNYVFASPPTIDGAEIFRLAEVASSSKYIKKQISFEKRMKKYKRGKISAVDILIEDEQDKYLISDSTKKLVNFVFGLELLIFKADSPNLSPWAIEDACKDKIKTIEKAITNTMSKYTVGEGLVAQITTNFMESPRFQSMIEQFGIKP